MYHKNGLLCVSVFHSIAKLAANLWTTKKIIPGTVFYLENTFRTFIVPFPTVTSVWISYDVRTAYSDADFCTWNIDLAQWSYQDSVIIVIDDRFPCIVYNYVHVAYFNIHSWMCIYYSHGNLRQNYCRDWVLRFEFGLWVTSTQTSKNGISSTTHHHHITLKSTRSRTFIM